MLSATFLPEATPRAITATNGPRCSLLTPTACSRNKVYCRRSSACGSGTKSSAEGEAGPRSILLLPFGEERPKSTPCCGIMVCWRHNSGAATQGGEMETRSHPARMTAASPLWLLFVGAPSGAQVQQVYRYVDAEGRVVYSDKPPPANAKDAQAKRIGAN